MGEFTYAISEAMAGFWVVIFRRQVEQYRSWFCSRELAQTWAPQVLVDVATFNRW